MRTSVRYLTMRPGAEDELPRWFWQPSSKLRAEGFRPQRVPLDWAAYTDARALQAAAVARAHDLNAHLDAVRTDAALLASRPAPPASARTLGDLIAAYRASRAYAKLALKTRHGYAQCLGKLELWGADAPVRAIDAKRVQRLQEGFAATPAYGNAVVRVLRLVLEFGRREGFVTVNVALRPGMLETNDHSVIWPREAVDVFVRAADAMGCHSMGTAVLLNEWLGQRQGDIIRMPRAALRAGGGTLIIRQSKTQAGVSLPLGMVPRLADRLAWQLARDSSRSVLATTIIVSEETGRPYAVDNFRHVFARVRAEAARLRPAFEVDYLLPGRDMTDPGAFTVRMAELTFMALRHTAVTRQAEAGSDTPQIAAITGHSQATVQQLMQRYMVRTAQLARAAFQRRLDAEAPAVAPTVVGANG